MYQDLHAYTDGFAVPAARSKPWGTAHAVLCAKDSINEPFAVINGDDFYGRDAFKKAYQFLTAEASDSLWANIGYELPNTLSEHGYVSRGVCRINESGNISSVVERVKIFRQDGTIVYEENEQLHPLAGTTKVSMNFWCFTPSIFDFSQALFTAFLQENIGLPKSEFFITLVGDEFIKQQKGNIKAITTSAKWFGVTYKEDKPIVQASIDQLVQEEKYPVSLWEKNFQLQAH